ncbi:MAG TPA: hypothetical protein PK156_31580, partial [Polyangium sp.]|nr:hypothetical protein [Polyangium sp.]
EKGNNELSVSPDIYVLPGIAPDANPLTYPGSKEEGCWKAWIHGVVPNFAVEIKARRNPRKDELQSPQRHDALGTKELIVFDPFSKGRRKNRKRFVLYRRDAANKLVPVLATNERKVYSEEIDAFIIAEGDGNESLLRLAVGPNGETLLPFDSELIAQQTQRAEEAARRAEEESRLRLEEARRADEAVRRAEELEAELARLRAGTRKRARL